MQMDPNTYQEVIKSMSEAQLKEALIELQEAFNKVNRHWEIAYKPGLLEDEYPFETDFDNMTCLVNGWIDANSKFIEGK